MIREWSAVGDIDGGPIAEKLLLEAGKSGDRHALGMLLSRYAESLYVLCHGILGNRDDAHDAVQETFLKAIGALARFRADSSVRTWLSRIAVNVCLDQRRARRGGTLDLDDTYAAVGGSASPESMAIWRLSIEQALRSLLPRHRAMLLLKEFEGWSTEEIATAFRCTRRRIYYELTFAHRQLAEWRRQNAGEGE